MFLIFFKFIALAFQDFISSYQQRDAKSLADLWKNKKAEGKTSVVLLAVLFAVVKIPPISKTV